MIDTGSGGPIASARSTPTVTATCVTSSDAPGDPGKESKCDASSSASRRLNGHESRAATEVMFWYTSVKPSKKSVSNEPTPELTLSTSRLAPEARASCAIAVNSLVSVCTAWSACTEPVTRGPPAQSASSSRSTASASILLSPVVASCRRAGLFCPVGAVCGD
eukprot:scaffold303395_cov30-Tisochrysis_lutea.AAC.4